VSSKVRVAIIGIQGFGKSYLNVLKTLPYVEVVALCDVNTEAAGKLAAQHGVPSVVADYRELLRGDRVDAVFVATPHFLHHEMTMAALRAGRHVFCEKPLAITARDAWEMAETARSSRRILTCHYNRRQTLAVKLLRGLTAAGTFGEIYHINVKWMARWTGFMFDSATSWRVSKAKAGGGILVGRGSHMLDAAWHILGKPAFESVSGVCANRLTGFEVDDYAMVVARLAGGTTVHMECSYEANLPGYGERIEYEVLGTRAGAICSAVDGIETIKVGSCAFPGKEWTDRTVDIEKYRDAAPRTIVEDFVEAVRDGREPFVTGEQGAAITQLLQAVYRSADSRAEVPFAAGRE
jgi:predicted dehydrogenase